jgi:hypothetical protein
MDFFSGIMVHITVVILSLYLGMFSSLQRKSAFHHIHHIFSKKTLLQHFSHTIFYHLFTEVNGTLSHFLLN